MALKFFENQAGDKVYALDTGSAIKPMTFDAGFTAGVKCLSKTVGSDLKLYKNATNGKILIVDKT